MPMIALSPLDLAFASVLILLDAALSLAFGLGLHRQIGWAAVRMTAQLLIVGLVLRTVLALESPAVTLLVVLLMMAAAAREVAARPERRLAGRGNLWVGAAAVGVASTITALLALTTAIRPDPWWEPRYAIPLVGIILGNVLNGASLSLDSLLAGVTRERGAIEAQLALGETIAHAMSRLRNEALRRGLVPIINQMSAAGIVTLPGIMTGQILAGVDPVEAVKYQILLMFLLAGGSGLASLAAVALTLRRLTDNRARLRLDRLSL